MGPSASNAPSSRLMGRAVWAGLLALLFLISPPTASPGGGVRGGANRIGGAGGGPHPPVSVWVFFSQEAWARVRPQRDLRIEGLRVRTRSEWLRAYSVSLQASSVPLLLGIPGVRGIRPVESMAPSALSGRVPFTLAASPPASPVPSAHQVSDTIYGPLGPVLDQLDIPPVHDLGYLGFGVRVGILDGFFQPGHPVFQRRPPVGVRDFVDDDLMVEPSFEDPQGAATHGSALWSLLGGDLPGVLVGGAPEADVFLARVGHPGGPLEADEDYWIAGLEWLESQGVRVVLSGFGFRDFPGFSYGIEDLNGDVTPATVAADEAARRGVLVVAPVGNGGGSARSLLAPSDGDSVLAVGALDRRGQVAEFSASGPTGDGRAKPDLFAPGEGLPAASDEAGDAVSEVAGTEFAGALIAGAAALFVEAHPDRGPMDILEALRLSVGSVPGGPPFLPQVASAIQYPGGITPLPLQEVSGSGEITTLAPQFRWDVPSLHPIGLPVTFFLDIAADSIFHEILLTDSVVGTFARRLREPLPGMTRFFWRVRARSAQGIRRASETLGPFMVPTWVTLEVLNEPGGVQSQDATPEFRWTARELPGPAGPLTFDLEVYSDRTGEVVQAVAGLEGETHRFSDALPFNAPLRWRVIAHPRLGKPDTVANAGPFVVTGSENPPVTILYQNFPNPFPSPEHGTWATRIWFDLAEASAVTLAVYDLRGRIVKSLIPGRGCGEVELPSGLYGRDGDMPGDPCAAFRWDGTDEQGRQVNPGVYLLRLEAGGVVDIRRIVFWP